MTDISYDDKRYLEKNIKLLDNVEYNEILKILLKNKQKYSANKTGIFFNLKYINDSTIKEMINFVNFCKKNRETFKLELDVQNINDNTEERNIETKEHSPDIIAENKDYFKKKFEFKLDSGILSNETDKFKSRSKEMNFSFKNYLDKISIISNKEFENNEYKYPTLNEPSDFGEVSDRIFKKCRNIDKLGIKNENNEKILEIDII